MPVRTYTGIDLINYATDNQLNAINGTVTPSTPSQGVASISGSASDGNAELSGYLELSGQFDFDVFPSIPDNALINSVTFKISGSISATASGAASASGSAGIGLSLEQIVPPASGTLMNDIFLGDSQSGGTSINISESDNFNNEQIFDFTGSPITKAQLVAQFTNLFIYLGGVEIGGFINNVFAGSSGSPATADASISINNFQMIVDYTSGPFTFTLSPSGGNVESGQQIAVSSPDIDVQTLNYAAIQDDKVIPLKISPDGNLTIPDPAPDPCTDCLGDCPECDDCVTACQEDLNSEACQECLQSCLDCLGNCLENLEAAEECQDSTQDPPGAVPITIICSDGTQFSGSVPLGNFTILLTNGSGIYRFIPGQTKDVLYSSTRDGSTYDVKIPNPFAKTGFFRS